MKALPKNVRVLRFDGQASMHVLAKAFRAEAVTRPDLAEVTVEAAGLDGFGLALMVTGLSVAAYTTDSLAGHGVGMGELSDHGGRLYAAVRDLGHAITAKHGQPGDAVAMLLAPNAVNKARVLFREVRAA